VAIFWASIPIGLALVAASVGIPFLLTHRGMRPDDPAEAHAYLDARDDMARTEDPGERRQAYLAARARRSDSACR
jgi:dihydropteroate synthase